MSRGGPLRDPDRLDSDGDGVACESLPCPCAAPGGGGGQGPVAPPPSSGAPPSAGGEPPAAGPPAGDGRGVLRSGRVVRVVDGDTIDVASRGVRVRVRLLGIDTPESVRPGRPVECGAKQASGFMRRAALGVRVRLSTDPTQDARDRYGRVLAYVRPAAGGSLLQVRALRAGWARVYVYRKRFRLYREFRRAELEARRARRGVWGMCRGDFHRPAR